MPIDPFKAADGTSWVILSQLLSQRNQRELALEISVRYLQLCFELQQKENERIHKGAPFFWVSERNHELDRTDEARGFMLLAFVEDVKEYGDPSVAPAYKKLVSIYGFAPSFLGNLSGHVRRLEPFPMFPEEALISWELEGTPTLSMLEEGSSNV